MPNEAASRVAALRDRISRADPATLDLILGEARTYSAFSDREVDEATLREAVALAGQGPTSMNCQPMRLMFLRKGPAREALLPHLAEGNRAKTAAAPVTAIVAQDLAFYENLPRTFPHFAGARAMFADNPALAEATAARNATLQGGYLIIALRSLGLDCGPMSGFNPAGVDEAFFAGTTVRSNFLINIGYGIPDALFPRQPRLGWEDVVLPKPMA